MQSRISNPHTQEDWVIYKHSQTEIVEGSVIVVENGQYAFLVKDKQILYYFDEGECELNQQNLPQFEFQQSSNSHQENSFNAEIYFANKMAELNLKWKTDKFSAVDNSLNGDINNFQFVGKIKLEIIDFLKFLGVFAIRDENVQSVYCKEITTKLYKALNNKLCTEIPQILKNQNSTLNLPEMSEELGKTLQNTYSFAGMNICFFSIEDFVRENNGLPVFDIQKPSQVDLPEEKSKYLKILQISSGTFGIIQAICAMLGLISNYIVYVSFPLIFVLSLHLMTIIFSKREGARIRGSIIGVVATGTFFVIMPFVSSVLPLISSIFIFVDAFKKAKVVNEVGDNTKKSIPADEIRGRENRVKWIGIIIGILEILVGIFIIIIIWIYNTKIDMYIYFVFALWSALHLVYMAKIKGDPRIARGSILGLISCVPFLAGISFTAFGHLSSGGLIIFDIYKKYYSEK